MNAAEIEAARIRLADNEAAYDAKCRDLLAVQSLTLKFLDDFRISFNFNVGYNQISWFDKKFTATKRPNLSYIKDCVDGHICSLSRILKQSV
jgi:hypothetical protein